MASTQWVNEYVGIPFIMKGRSRAGADCWGLVRIVLAEHYEVFVPSLSVFYDDLSTATIVPLVGVMQESRNFTKVDAPQEGDIVLMTFFGQPCHVGICIDADHVLHSDPLGRSSSRVERLASPRISTRIEGYYRVG